MSWGEEYFLLPKGFTRVLTSHCVTNCKMTPDDVSTKLNAFLNEGRVTARYAAKVSLS